MRLPLAEKQTLLLRVLYADEYAAAGEWAAGYDLLLNAQRGAEELQHAGQPYTAELLRRSQAELTAYSDRHGPEAAVAWRCEGCKLLRAPIRRLAAPAGV